MKIIITTNTFRSILMGMAMPYFSLYILALGGTAPTIGLINALGALANLILSPIGGYLADSKGRVKLLAFLTFMDSLAFIFFVLANEWTLLAFGWFFRNLFMFNVSIENTIVADSLKPDERATGFAAIMAIPGIAGIASPFLAGYLIEKFELEFALRLLYAFSVALIFAIAIIRLKYLKETIVSSKESISLKDFFQLFKTSFSRIRIALKWMPTSLRSIMTISFINNLFVMMVTPFTVVYAINIIKLSVIEWGLIMLVMRGIRAFLMIPLGMFLDKYGKRKTLFCTLALSSLPVFLFAYSKTFLSTFIIFLIIIIINTVNEPAFLALMADIVPMKMRGRINTAIGSGVVYIGMIGTKPPARGFLLSIATLIGSFIGGYLYDYNPTYLWIIFSFSLIVCFLLFIVYVREPKAS